MVSWGIYRKTISSAIIPAIFILCWGWDWAKGQEDDPTQSGEVGAAELPTDERRVRPVDPAARAEALREAQGQDDGRAAEETEAGGETGESEDATEPEADVAEDEAVSAATDQPARGRGQRPRRLSPEERAEALRRASSGRNGSTPVAREPDRRVPRAAGGRGAAEAEADPLKKSEIELMREHLAQFYENQRLISEEWSDWQLAEDMLESRINLLEDQIKRVRQDTEERRGTIQETDREKAELADKNQMLGELNDYQRRQIKTLENNMRILYQKLPDPLKQEIKGLADRLPERNATSDEIKASVSARYATVIGMLSQIDKFNRQVHHEPGMTVDVGEGEQAAVDMIYLGIGQGYYVQMGASEPVAGHGVPGSAGWVWTRDDELAPEISRMVEIYTGEGTADYLGVPAKIE